jgi:F420H2 dehydrogenase subunit N
VNALLPQSALLLGVLGALGLGLLRRPPALALRAIGAASVLAAMALSGFMPIGAELAPLVRVDALGASWQYAIYLGALPLAFWNDGEDDAFVALFLGSTLGMGLLAAAANLPMLFVALEFMSLPAYLLVARSRPGARGLAGALKYFFAGGLAGALFMLGLALYYAETRSLAESAALGPLGQGGVALMGAAALFKLGAVPLHWWLPDAYDSADPALAGFLSTAMKAAGTLFLMRLCQFAPQAAFPSVLPAVGAVTALAGATLALRERRLQRLLAYSSISHAGFLILGVGAWATDFSPAASGAILLYLGVYAFMSNGAFGALKLTGLETREQLRGLGAGAPATAAALTVLLFSLAGVPPTGGFFVKLLVLWRAVETGLGVWAAVAGVSALVSLGVYLGLVRDLWLEEPAGAAPAGERGRALVWGCAAGALLMGAAPWLMGLMGFGGFTR